MQGALARRSSSIWVRLRASVSTLRGFRQAAWQPVKVDASWVVWCIEAFTGKDISKLSLHVTPSANVGRHCIKRLGPTIAGGGWKGRGL